MSDQRTTPILDRVIHNSSMILTLVVAFIGNLIFSINYVVRQEARFDSRISALELAVTNNHILIEAVTNSQRNLNDRVDRQETPLSRRVDAHDVRIQNLTERLLVLEGRVNEMRSQRPPP